MPVTIGDLSDAATINKGSDDADPMHRAWMSRVWLLWASMFLLAVVAHLCYGYELDELMHLHTGWDIGHGLLPYRDFFENHVVFFHMLLAPFVASQTTATLPCLLACRVFAALIGLLCLLLCSRLLRRAHPLAPLIGVGTLLLVHPFAGVGLELRPDWTALAFVLAALLTLASDARYGQSRSSSYEVTDSWCVARALVSGVFIGIGICMTQKAAFPAFAILLWSIITAFLAPSASVRRLRASAAAAVLIGILTPVSLYVLYFVQHHSLDVMINSVVRINSKWGQEVPLLYGGQEGMLAAFPVFVLAYSSIARLYRDLRSHLSGCSLESLLAIILLVCTLAYLRTPVPNSQWFLFLIVPWSACLSALGVCRYADVPDQLKRDRVCLFVGVVLCVLLLKWPNNLISLVGWGAIVRLCWKRMAAADANGRFRILATGALGVTLLVSAGRAVVQLFSGNARRQADMIAYVDKTTPAAEPVLAIWPVMTPFREAPTYHWFVTNGIYHAISSSSLEVEYIDAMRHSKTHTAIVRPADLVKNLPHFNNYLAQACVLERTIKLNGRPVCIYRTKDRDQIMPHAP